MADSGCLAGHEHKRAPLFNGHFRRAVQHVHADAVGDRRRRAGAARHNDHPRREQTAAGNQGSLVVHVYQRYVAVIQ